MKTFFIGFIFTFSFSILSKSKTTSSFLIAEIPVENENKYFIYISLYKNLHISSKKNICDVYIIRFYNTHRGKLKCKKKQNRSIFKYVTAKHFLSLYLQQTLKEQWLSRTAKLLQSSEINLCGQNYLLTRTLLLLFLFQFCRKTKL